jgi:hypothetical protein
LLLLLLLLFAVDANDDDVDGDEKVTGCTKGNTS